MSLLFASTLFLSSALLFLVQPMYARMVLPQLGGTPAVWNTCQVFFQATLFLGYLYAHQLPKWLGTKSHLLLHVVLLMTPILVLPVIVPADAAPPANGSPILWLLLLLTLTVGLPFFVISTTAPLLQHWFAQTGHTSAQDPYYLYAASNLGSLLALASYPFLVEPNLRLASQSRLWSILYGFLALLICLCALTAWRKIAAQRIAVSSSASGQTTVPWRLRLRWLLLAFVPSGLLLSVTAYFTTDIAAIPLLWVIPLATYLLTFVLAFARRVWIPHWAMVRVMPLAVLALCVVMLTKATEPIWILLPLHLGVFFIISMVCHGELAKSRPSTEALTSFYTWMALGGILGGLFCALVAPLVFSGTYEYPLLLVIASVLRPLLPGEQNDPEILPHEPVAARTALRNDLLFPLLIGGLTLALVVGLQAAKLEHSRVSVGIMFGLPAVLCYLSYHRPLRFALGIGAVLLAGAFYEGVYGGTVLSARSFFGVHRVTLDPTGTFIQLVHGNTIHGRQSLLKEHRDEPLTYYERTGPIGQVFLEWLPQENSAPVGVVGLGAGSLAAYGQPNQEFTYFEIDPVVEAIARNPSLFTFLQDTPAKLRIVLGDARLTLREAQPSHFHLLVIDAFSSDAIPMHLLTREALALYESRLDESGMLAFNISNRYLDLEPVLGDLARDAGLVCTVRHDQDVTPEELARGKYKSDWVVMARKREHLGPLAKDPRWTMVLGHRGRYLWTDDFNNLFEVFQWFAD